MARATLVTIHGFWSSPQTWDPLVDVWRRDPQLRDVDIHGFGYESPRRPTFPLSPVRVPDHDDIAQSFATDLRVRFPDGPVAVVTHSQGGLILQRYLAWMLQQGRGRELERIASVVMLACPNNGSDYLRSLRRAVGARRHPQAARLQVLDRQVADTQRAVLTDVIHARAASDRQCPIPFHVYAGSSDRVVTAASAQAAFPRAATVRGDHSSVLDPQATGNHTAETVRFDVIADLVTWEASRRARPAPTATVGGGDPAGGTFRIEGPVSFGGSVRLEGRNVSGRDMHIGGMPRRRTGDR